MPQPHLKWKTDGQAIVLAFEKRTTQEVVEGINNKLKVIERSGFEFKNFDNFPNKVIISLAFN